MNAPGTALATFPSNDATNYGVLYSSLGTFWTHVFKDRDALRGLSVGQSEELIQRYYDFIDAVSSLSVKEVPELKRERWYPLKIRKSAVRLSPLIFRESTDPEVAKFGEQPINAGAGVGNDGKHYGETYQFGRTKRPVEFSYVVELPEELKHLPVLVNRVVAPSLSFVHGVDYKIVDGKIIFNFDPFGLQDTMRYQLFDDAGQPVSYVKTTDYYDYASGPDTERNKPAEETIEEDEELILWGYHASVDADTLYRSFGYIFDFRDPDPHVYKQILRSVVNLFVEGPTIQAFTSLLCAFIGVESSVHPTETILDAYETEGKLFVITDKQVYSATTAYSFSSAVYSAEVNVGKVITAGTLLFDAVEYHDQVSSPGWWHTQVPVSLGLPPFMFLGGYHGLLVFQNLTGNDRPLISEVITVDGINFPFPSNMDQRDVDLFNEYLSHEDRIDTVSALITEYGDAHDDRLNPLDFIFTYFMKTNTAFVKVILTDWGRAARFTQFFQIVRDTLPKYVFLLVQLNLPALEDSAVLLRNATTVDEIGSDSSNYDGWVRQPPYDVPPWKLKFGIADSPTDNERTFVIGKTLNLFSTYTDAYGTFYQRTKGPSGSYDIVADQIDLTANWVDGGDLGNVPRAYPATGTITVNALNNTLTGNGTKFTTTLAVGQYVYAADVGEYRKIASIEGDEGLTLETQFSGSTRTFPLFLANVTPSMQNIRGLVFWSL